MVRIRLRRVGLKGQPSYRIVVADQRSARDGRFIEVIGFYNPRTEPPTDELDEARALHWLSVGAQPSDAVKYILNRTGTQERFERLRKGESLETLVAEAQAAKEAAGAPNRKTSHPAPEAGQSWIKARQAAQASSESEA
jgi:small subunit ribosomal protein S16